MHMGLIKYQKYLLQLKEVFLEENQENTKMLDVYFKFIKSLGMGFLVLLPFSPVTIPYLVKKAKEHKIDIIPRWYKSLRKHQDTLE